MTLPLSDHFNGKTFFQSHHREAGRYRDLLRWQLSANRKPWPKRVQLPPQPPPPRPSLAEVIVTWIGHASFLLQTTRVNVLIDPVFSDRASPVRWLGPRRVHAPGVTLANLPRIDAVLISHDHYDHLDVDSIRALADRFNPRFIAPLRHSGLLTSLGASPVSELDWWQTCPLVDAMGPQVMLTPSKHWSNRFGTPRNYRLWGGFFFQFASKRVWFAGDTGYDEEIFRAVRQHCGSPELALLPIGAYEPRWFMAPMHMNPTEAVRAHRDIGARRSIGMHWGTFQLTDEGRDDPVIALDAARSEAGLAAEEFCVLVPGESRVI